LGKKKKETIQDIIDRIEDDLIALRDKVIELENDVENDEDEDKNQDEDEDEE
jgi:hypothetical protein